jgi:aquaporin Z
MIAPPESRRFRGSAAVLRSHWPEYLIEAAGLGIFMVSAGLIATLLFAPGSPLASWQRDPLFTRLLMGAAMGLTAIAIVYSPWGMRSGAHLNPALTLTFWRLGKVRNHDAAFYIIAQFAGGLAGVLLVAAVLGNPFRNTPVHYVATLPGPQGSAAAWFAEVGIAFVQMSAILFVTNRASIHRYAGVVGGTLVAAYIALESPISGMSLNPARTLASALPAAEFSTLWIYFTAPPLGMLLAAALYTGRYGRHHVKCAKMYHDNDQPCIFECGYTGTETADTGLVPGAGPRERQTK